MNPDGVQTVHVCVETDGGAEWLFREVAFNSAARFALAPDWCVCWEIEFYRLLNPC